MVGRYPDYDVLSQQRHWDEATRRVVLARVENPPPIRFFDEAEAADAARRSATSSRRRTRSRGSRCSRSSTTSSTRGLRDGWRYFDLPDDDELWRRVARGLDEEARARAFESFADASIDAQVEHRPPLLESRAPRRRLGHAERRARLGDGDAVRGRRLLRAPVGLERDRLRRPGVPARLRRVRQPAPRRARRAGRRARRCTSTRCATTRERVSLIDARQGVARDAARTTTRRSCSTRTGAASATSTGWRATASTDAVDLVVVGAGAGGIALAQRLARAGLAGRGPREGPVLGPGPRLGERRGGLATASTGPSSGSSPAATRSRWARTTPASASAGR